MFWTGSLWLGFYSLFLLLICFFWVLRAVVRRGVLVHIIEQLPGPAAWPVIGNLKGFSLDRDMIFSNTAGIINLWSNSSAGAMRIWAGWNPMVFVSSPTAVEPIATSNVNLDKSREYSTLKSWLGSGLVTVEGGPQWFSRRRMLTPAFHFSILDDFISVMNEQCGTLVKLLSEKVGRQGFDICPYLNRCALDIICGSAMGCSTNAQTVQDSDYNQAIESMSLVIQTKFHRPWLQSSLLFKMSKFYTIQKKALTVLKGFTRKVIEEKRAELHQRQGERADMQDLDKGQTRRKRRLAFLDLILTSTTPQGEYLTDDEIQDEVDTFMFAGHDTVTAGMSWCLFLLGLHPEIQETCYEELTEVFGDSMRHVTSQDLRKLKYLECCVKEAQRLYPSAPFWGRNLKESINIDGTCVPAGTTVMVALYSLHRNPEVWPDPENFDPDRFLTENVVGRHPYAFIPFSAGSRNCIGQRFALSEEKVVLATLLRHFKFESLDRRDEITLFHQLILKSKNGLRMKVHSRN